MSERLELTTGGRLRSWQLALAALLSLLVGAALFILQRQPASAPASPRVSARTTAGVSPLSLAPAARAAISAALGARETAYHLTAVSRDRLRGFNSAQHMRISFDRSGAQLDARGARLGLGLRALGYGDALRTLPAVKPQGEANRVTYARAAISEWYVNGPLGLEQGFTLARAPVAHARGPLTLALATTGDGRASLASGGQSVTFSGAHGPTLRYGGLSANDADGRALRSWLALQDGTLLLRVDTRGARFPVHIDPIVDTPETRLTPSSGEEGERAGVSVALSADGTTALVGAPGEETAGGAVWVFVRSGSSWTEQAELLAPKPESGPRGCFGESGVEEGECGFGRSVALSADGNTALIGAPRENSEKGAAWIYTREGSTWTERAELTNPKAGQTGNFGLSVALSSDGETALVGAPADIAAKGEAWVFEGSGSGWAERADLLGGADEVGEGRFGVRVALSGDGEVALIGAPATSDSVGAAWAFQRSQAGWSEEGTELTGAAEVGKGRFGDSVALSQDGSTAVVGARDDAENVGAAWVFTRSGSAWSEQGPKLSVGEGKEGFGYSAALSASGNKLVLGAPRYEDALGVAWLFERSGTTWAKVHRLDGEEVEGRGRFGASVAVSSDASIVLVGGPHASTVGGAEKGGAALVFGPAPSVDSVAPKVGREAGGEPVTITGDHLLSATAVRFGAAAATHFEAISEEVIQAVSPPGTGTVAVTVETPFGTSRANTADLFSYAPEGEIGDRREEGAKPGGPTGGSGAGSSSGGSPSVVASSAVLAAGPIGGPACGASLRSKTISVQAHARALLKLRGTGTGNCAGKLRLRVNLAHRGNPPKLETIGTAIFSITSGRTLTVKVKLNAVGRALLAADHGRLNASLLIVKISPAPSLARTASVRLRQQQSPKPKRPTLAGALARLAHWLDF